MSLILKGRPQLKTEMPKKFKGENSKAVEARARKAAVHKDAQDKKKEELEDEYWKDDDKNMAKKQQRKVSYFILSYLYTLTLKSYTN